MIILINNDKCVRQIEITTIIRDYTSGRVTYRNTELLSRCDTIADRQKLCRSTGRKLAMATITTYSIVQCRKTA